MLFQGLFFLMMGVSVSTFAGETDREFITSFRSYTSFNYLKTQFDQEKHVRELKSPLITSGILTVDRDSGSLTWEVTKPSHLSAEIKGDQVTIETGSGAEKNRQVYKSWKEMSDFINFDPQKIIKKFKVVKVANLTYEFLPQKDSQAPFSKLVVTANKEGFLSRLEMHEVSGDYFVLKFSSPIVRRSGKR